MVDRKELQKILDEGLLDKITSRFGKFLNQLKTPDLKKSSDSYGISAKEIPSSDHHSYEKGPAGSPYLLGRTRKETLRYDQAPDYNKLAAPEGEITFRYDPPFGMTHGEWKRASEKQKIELNKNQREQEFADLVGAKAYLSPEEYDKVEKQYKDKKHKISLQQRKALSRAKEAERFRTPRPEDEVLSTGERYKPDFNTKSTELGPPEEPKIKYKDPNQTIGRVKYDLQGKPTSAAVILPKRTDRAITMKSSDVLPQELAKRKLRKEEDEMLRQPLTEDEYLTYFITKMDQLCEKKKKLEDDMLLPTSKKQSCRRADPTIKGKPVLNELEYDNEWKDLENYYKFKK